MTETTTLTFSESEPLRLDRYLAMQIEGVSRSYLQDLILQGLVRVNGKVAEKGHVLRAGDEVKVESFIRPEDRTLDPNPSISVKIVHQERNWLIVDKPAGLPTHPNDFSDTRTLANAVLAKFPAVLGVGDDPLRPGIVHRLDSDTSGLLIVAKTQTAFKAFRAMFDQRKVKKMYVALVLGKVTKGKSIDTPIAHHPKNPRKMTVALPGAEVRSRIREAKTMYEPVERFGDYTLLHVRTLTGRMHQVRVHLSSIGHPLAGDRLYQNPTERQKDKLTLGRHFLHAAEISFPSPETGEVVTFQSPLAHELEACLETLRQIKPE